MFVFSVVYCHMVLFIVHSSLLLPSNLFWCVFFFKQKTAYEMRISDWSSDVCSSDLSAGKRAPARAAGQPRGPPRQPHRRRTAGPQARRRRHDGRGGGPPRRDRAVSGHLRGAAGVGQDRTSVVEGKSVSVRVDPGGRRFI